MREAAAAHSAADHQRQPIVYHWLFLAMTHSRLGHAAEARQWLKQAAAAMDSSAAENPKQAAPDSWNRRLTRQVLRREGEALIKEMEAKQAEGKR